MTNSPLYFGLEIGGTKLQLGLGRGDGVILALVRRTIRPEAGAQGILGQVVEAHRELVETTRLTNSPPEVLGIGFGGPVDVDRGVALRSHQVHGWDEFDLRGWVQKTLGIGKVVVQNDADTAGFGEAQFGAGRVGSPIFYVTVGSGIGGGLILDGKIYRGSGSGAVEIGHLWVDDLPQGPQRLEDVASGWSIGQSARALIKDQPVSERINALIQGSHAKIDAKIVALAAAEGNPHALAVLGTATKALGQCLAHLVTLVAPKRIILGGGVSMIADSLWLNPIQDVVDSRSFPPFRGTFDIVRAQLGEEVVVHGALALARDLEL